MKIILSTLVISLACLSCQNNVEQNTGHHSERDNDHNEKHEHDHSSSERAHEHGHEHSEHNNHQHKLAEKEVKNKQISFHSEQAKTIDFAVEQVKQQNIHQVIHASGQIESMQGDEQIITAKTSGIVLFNTDKTLIGKAVTSGQDLCTISGSGMTNDNIESQFVIAKAEYEKADAAYNRGEKLAVTKTIAASEFDELKAKLEIRKTKYLTLQNNFSNGGKRVKAPFAGFIKNMLVDEGQYVHGGDPLMIVSKNKKLVIRADVSQKYFTDLPYIQSANFRTAYDTSVHSIEDFNGRLISYAKNVRSASNYLPVYFEIDNKGKLLPGAFIEVFLKTKPISNTIAVPLSAVMEDYETQYVFIRTSHETYEKKLIKLGVNDGQKVQVLSGIKKGDWVVTKGAYQIKMASASSTIPSHGHSH